MKYRKSHIVLAILFLFSCTATKKASVKTDDNKLEVVFIQINDVYEIAPLAGGKMGGMARVASLKKQYKASNPNTFLIMAGDFLSPSVYNSLQFSGERIRGKQMVEAMNAAQVDIAIFGNHEFDIAENELQSRINESAFSWVASNAFHAKNGTVQAFEKNNPTGITSIPKSMVLNVSDRDGTMARIGLIGITLPFNRAEYVSYTDPFEAAKLLYDSLKLSCDAVIAITHQLMESDRKLARQHPQLAVILGGHEHDMRFEKIGNTYITKAHANAKSAFIVKVNIDKENRSTLVEPALKILDDSVQLDSATNVVVENWMNIAANNYSSLGFDAKKVLILSGDSLEGRESETRRRPTNFTTLIVQSMANACPEADIAIMNAGSIRLDDVLQPPITQYDIIRSLPYGGPIRELDVKGRLLIKILDTGARNKGTGGFLHAFPIQYDTTTKIWDIKGVAIDPEKVYRLAVSDFLVTGKEVNLAFLNKDNPDVISVKEPELGPDNPKSDIRLAIIKYVEKSN